MFEQRKKRMELENEFFEKVLSLLKNTNNWAKTGDIIYSHLESELKIEYGLKIGYCDNYMVRHILEPECLDIPLRFRERFKSLLQIINNRKNENSPLQFLIEYLNGEYPSVCCVIIEEKKQAEVKKWLQEQGITDFYIKKTKIWFKKEEDAVATKIVWVK